MAVTHSTAERTGTWLGRQWLKLVRREKQFSAWLVTKGVPAGAATALLWIIKLSLLAVVLCFSLTVALLVAALLIIARVLSHADLSADEDRPRWRYGLHGYGLYDHKGARIDPHDPNEIP